MKIHSVKILACSAVIGNAAAFTPPPAVVTRSVGPQTLSVGTAPPAVAGSAHMGATSTTALQMNLVDRFFRVAKANVNLVLSNLEDPERIIDQALLDMQKDLVKVRQAYAQVTATQRRLMTQKNQHEAISQDWYERAQLALQRNKEDLARQALTRRQVALDQAEAVQKEMNVNGAALDKLYESLQTLEQKIIEAKEKKQQITARARTAKATMQVNDMLSGLTGKTSMDAFRRMEEKVEALEAAAEASAEHAALPSSKPAEFNLEKEFLQLEASAAVDEELKQLKGMLKESKTEIKNALKESKMEQDFRVEKELRVMQKNIKIPVQWDSSS